MADKNSVSESSALTGEGEGTAPEYITKTELNAMLNGFRATFKKDLTELKSALQTLQTPKEEVELAKANKSTTSDPEKAEMQKQIKLLLEREKERDAELASQRLNSALREHLTAAGVDGRHIDHALAYVNHKQMVKYDEDGNIKIKVNQVDYDLADGAKLWAKQEDAKLYLAPKGAVGSGQKGAVQQQGAPVSDQRAKVDQQFNELLKQLPAAMNGV